MIVKKECAIFRVALRSKKLQQNVRSVRKSTNIICRQASIIDAESKAWFFMDVSISADSPVLPVETGNLPDKVPIKRPYGCHNYTSTD